MQITRISSPVNTTKAFNQSQTPVFKGKTIKPESKLFKNAKNKVEMALAEFISKYILETKTAKWLVEKTQGSEKLPLHLGTLTGTTLSLFYMKKTLENKKLDSQKKKTLAINQGATTVLSTILSYSLNGFLTKSVDKFTDKFLEINSSAAPATKLQYKKGIKTAAQLMIFQTIFRFVAPVAVTPIANHLGNKLQEKKEAEKLGKKQND